MHLPDGFLTGEVNAATFAVTVTVCGVALARARRTLSEKQVPLLGVTAAFTFAAQMLNYPILPGVSGHYVGALLAAILAGPLNACLIMTVVLLLQCLLFMDGGLTALGSNIFNMGLVAGTCSYGIFWLLKSFRPRNRNWFLFSAGLTAWLSAVVASACCAGELCLSGRDSWGVALKFLVGYHALIGIGEAVVTVSILSTVLAVRPDLVQAWPAQRDERLAAIVPDVAEVRP